MKKTLAFALIATAISAQAISFVWNSNNVKIAFGTDTTIASAGGIIATLLYLGTDDTATINGFEVSNGLEVDSKATASSGAAASKGKYSKEFTKVLGTAFGDEENAPRLSAGDYFTVLLTYEDTENNVTWINLAQNTWQIPEDALDITQDLTASFTHTFTKQEKGTALSAGGGWVQVPEPSTAMLALAGLALLLKRRKA